MAVLILLYGKKNVNQGKTLKELMEELQQYQKEKEDLNNLLKDDKEKKRWEEDLTGEIKKRQQMKNEIDAKN